MGCVWGKGEEEEEGAVSQVRRLLNERRLIGPKPNPRPVHLTPVFVFPRDAPLTAIPGPGWTGRPRCPGQQNSGRAWNVHRPEEGRRERGNRRPSLTPHATCRCYLAETRPKYAADNVDSVTWTLPVESKLNCCMW